MSLILEMNGKRSSALSITHILCTDFDADLGVGEAGEAAPHDEVPGGGDRCPWRDSLRGVRASSDCQSASNFDPEYCLTEECYNDSW